MGTKAKTILTIREVAKEFGVPEFAVRGFVKRGEIPCIMSGTRAYISREVFGQFLQKGGEMRNEAIQPTSR